MSYYRLPLLMLIIPFIGAALVNLPFRKLNIINKIIAVISSLIPFAISIMLIKPIIINGQIILTWLGNKIQNDIISIGTGLEIDAFSLVVLLIVTFIMLMVLLYSFKIRNNDNRLNRFLMLFLIFEAGVTGLLISGDLFNIFVLFEIMGISIGTLIAFGSEKTKSYEHAFKFIILNTFGSLLILLGVTLLYAEAHTLSIAQLSVILYGKFTSISILGFIAIFAGCIVKVFLFPFIIGFHSIEDSGLFQVTSLFSSIFSMSGIYVIVRIIYIIYQNLDISKLSLFIVILGTFLIVIGLLFALKQTDIMRIIGSHSVVQIGYIVVALGMGNYFNVKIGIVGTMGGIYHIFSYLLFISLLFMVVSGIYYSVGTTDISKIGGIFKDTPFLAVMFFIGVMSMVGIPPLDGFVSKWLIYKSTYQAKYYFLTAVLVLVSLITLISFMRIAYIIFFRKFDNNNEIKKLPWIMKIPMIITASMCVVTGIIPSVVSKYFIQPAASAIYNESNYIDIMFTKGYASRIFNEKVTTQKIDYSIAGYLKPEAWLLILFLLFIALIIFFWIYFRFPADVSKDADNVKSTAGIKNIAIKVYSGIDRYIEGSTVNDYAMWIIFLFAVAIIYIFSIFNLS